MVVGILIIIHFIYRLTVRAKAIDFYQFTLSGLGVNELLYFRIISPEEIGYIFSAAPAKDFGGAFVSTTPSWFYLVPRGFLKITYTLFPPLPTPLYCFSLSLWFPDFIIWWDLPRSSRPGRWLLRTEGQRNHSGTNNPGGKRVNILICTCTYPILCVLHDSVDVNTCCETETRSCGHRWSFSSCVRWPLLFLTLSLLSESEPLFTVQCESFICKWNYATSACMTLASLSSYTFCNKQPSLTNNLVILECFTVYLQSEVFAHTCKIMYHICSCACVCPPEVALLYKRPDMWKKQGAKLYWLLIMPLIMTVNTWIWSLMGAPPNQAYLLYFCWDAMGKRHTFSSGLLHITLAKIVFIFEYSLCI